MKFSSPLEYYNQNGIELFRILNKHQSYSDKGIRSFFTDVKIPHKNESLNKSIANLQETVNDMIYSLNSLDSVNAREDKSMKIKQSKFKYKRNMTLLKLNRSSTMKGSEKRIISNRDKNKSSNKLIKEAIKIKEVKNFPSRNKLNTIFKTNLPSIRTSQKVKNESTTSIITTNFFFNNTYDNPSPKSENNVLINMPNIYVPNITATDKLKSLYNKKKTLEEAIDNCLKCDKITKERFNKDLNTKIKNPNKKLTFQKEVFGIIEHEGGEVNRFKRDKKLDYLLEELKNKNKFLRWENILKIDNIVAYNFRDAISNKFKLEPKAITEEKSKFLKSVKMRDVQHYRVENLLDDVISKSELLKIKYFNK